MRCRDAERVNEAVRAVAARMPTYITLKDVKKRWGKGQEDIFPVAQFEKLWGDMTALPELDCRFVAVGRMRGQQLKEPAQLDAMAPRRQRRLHRVVVRVARDFGLGAHASVTSAGGRRWDRRSPFVVCHACPVDDRPADHEKRSSVKRVFHRPIPKSGNFPRCLEAFGDRQSAIGRPGVADTWSARVSELNPAILDCARNLPPHADCWARLLVGDRGHFCLRLQGRPAGAADPRGK